MLRPRFAITPEGLAAYANMFEIAVSPRECEALAPQLSAGLDGLADLRAVDVAGIEPFVAFPIDRVAR